MKIKLFLASIAICSLIACGKNTNNDAQTPLASGPQKMGAIEPGNSDNVEMVKVEAGEFIFGSNKTDTEGMQERYGFPQPLFLDEHPQQKIPLPAYFIDKYEVSLKQYKEYITKTDQKKPLFWFQNGYALEMSEARTMEMKMLRMIAADHFRLDMDTNAMTREQLIPPMEKKQREMDNFPVTGITWQEANEYCQWRDQRLPTEAEWEKAARGPNGNEFPWGNQWDTQKTETGDDSEFEEGFAPIGAYPQNKSFYGAYDMGGNVWEWVADWYQAYPGSSYQNENFGQKNKVIRGGGGGVGHYAISYFFRGATRQFAEPEIMGEDVGFRCAKDI